MLLRARRLAALLAASVLLGVAHPADAASVTTGAAERIKFSSPTCQADPCLSRCTDFVTAGYTRDPASGALTATLSGVRAAPRAQLPGRHRYRRRRGQPR